VKYVRNLAGVLFTSAVSTPMGFATSILLARWLSTDDRGFYAIAFNFAALSTMIFQLGWPTASIYRLRNRVSPPAEVSAAALIANTIVSVAVVGLALPFESLLRERYLGGLPYLVFALILATIPFRIQANGFGAIARGIDHFRFENWYAFLLQLGTLLAVVVAVLWMGGALDELIVALTAVYVVVSTLLVAAVLAKTGLTWRVRVSEMRESLRFGMKTFMMTVLGRVHERIDIFMLAALLGDPTQIAYYAIAKGVVHQLQVLPNAMGKVAYPHLAGLENRDAAQFASALTRQGTLFMLPASVVLLVAAPYLIPFMYGEEYAASTIPFLLLLPGIVLLGTDRVLVRYFTATDQQMPNVITRAISLAVNVVLNWLWIPTWGISGAAAAALVSYVVDALLIVWVFRLLTHVPLLDIIWIRRSDFDPYRRRLDRLVERLRPGAP
jgi:O-antigen/teichoic acid export membrane protein